MHRQIIRMLGEFHPGVFKAMAAFAALFVLGSWGFAGHGVTDLVLVVASFFVLVSTGLVALIWLTRSRHPRADLGDRKSERDSFGDWVAHDVETSTGPVRGSIATVETLLPIAAVAVGMVAFAVVLHFAGHA